MQLAFGRPLPCAENHAHLAGRSTTLSPPGLNQTSTLDSSSLSSFWMVRPRPHVVGVMHLSTGMTAKASLKWQARRRIGCGSTTALPLPPTSAQLRPPHPVSSPSVHESHGRTLCLALGLPRSCLAMLLGAVDVVTRSGTLRADSGSALGGRSKKHGNSEVFFGWWGR